MAIQDLAGSYGLLPDYVELPPPGAPVSGQGLRAAPAAPAPMGSMPTLADFTAAPPPAAPEAAGPVAVSPLAPAVSPTTGRLDLASLLDKYQAGESSYAREIAKARGTLTAETQAFNQMLEKAISAQGEAGPSKAEMYFRLAAAFGTPTKTGSFVESLGEVGKTMSQFQKEEREAKRAGQASKLQLALKGQEAKMAAAREDVTNLRTLAAEEMKDKRAIATKLIEEYINSGKPQSEAGKQALDLGLRPGTPEYQRKVDELMRTSIDARLAQINVQLANLNLREREAAKLSPAELKLKEETSDAVSSGEEALKNLSEAYRLNPNTFDSSLVDVAQQKLLEAVGSKDPKVVATRYQANLLSKQAIAKLRSSFGGNPTEGERAALLALEGIDSKSKEERALIIRNTYSLLKARVERERRKLADINAGLYRQTTKPEVEQGGLE